MSLERTRLRLRYYSSITFLLLLTMQVAKVDAQTTSGQAGTFLTPSADTYPSGSFTTGSYFRSLSFGEKRFDETPIYFITGLSPRMEVGFGFPGIWGNETPPIHFESHTQLSLKYRIHGDKSSKWKLAIAGLVQRSPLMSDTSRSDAATTGLQVINSFKLPQGYSLHSFIAAFLQSNSRNRDQQLIGLGVERFIGQQFQFSTDLLATSENILLKQTAVTAVTGMKYYWKPNIQVSLGGGVGLSGGSYDWQYLLGFSFSAESKKIIYEQPVSTPQLILDLSNTTEQPAEELSKGVPPPPSADEPQSTEPTVVTQTVTVIPELNGRYFFDEKSYKLSTSEENELNETAHELVKLDPKSLILVNGHSDPIGSKLDNRAWGMARALTVSKRVLTESGLVPNRILISGFGESRVNNSKDSPATRQLNRRVELKTTTELNAILENSDRDTSNNSLLWKSDLSKSVSNSEQQELSQKISNCLDQVGKLDSKEVLVIDAGWDPHKDYRTTLQSVSQFWLTLTQVAQIDASQIYLHIHPADAITDNTKLNTVQSSLHCEKSWIESNEEEVTVNFSLVNENATQAQEGYYCVVADIPDGRISDQIGKMESGQIPKYEQGTKFTVKQHSQFSSTIQVPQNQREDARYSVYLFDKTGKLISRIPVIDPTFSPRWSKRFFDALDLPVPDKSNPTIIKFQFKKCKYPSNIGQSKVRKSVREARLTQRAEVIK